MSHIHRFVESTVFRDSKIFCRCSTCESLPNNFIWKWCKHSVIFKKQFVCSKNGSFLRIPYVHKSICKKKIYCEWFVNVLSSLSARKHISYSLSLYQWCLQRTLWTHLKGVCQWCIWSRRQTYFVPSIIIYIKKWQTVRNLKLIGNQVTESKWAVRSEKGSLICRKIEVVVNPPHVIQIS